MKMGSTGRDRRHLPVISILLAIALLAGCASAKFIATGPTYPAKADDCEIEVYSSRPPDREYEEIGIIEGEGSMGADSLEDVLPKMKIEACRAGGDAIILMSSQKSVEIYGESSDQHLNTTATVIRWVE